MKTYVPQGNITGFIIPEFLHKLKLSSGAKMMYAALCSYSCGKDNCYPLQETLSKRLNICVRTVINNIRELVDKGLIFIEEQDGARNKYYFICPTLLNLQEQGDGQEATVAENLEGANIAHGSAKFSKRGETFAPRKKYNNKFIKTPPYNPPMTDDPPRVSRRSEALSPPAGCVFDLVGFEKVWEAYPRKESRQKAFCQWNALAKAGSLPAAATLLATIERWRTTDAWKKENGRFVPRLARWLAEHRWEDELSESDMLTWKRVEHEKSQKALASTKAREALEREKQKRTQLFTEFEKFASLFPESSDKGQAFNVWITLHEQGMAPTQDVIPADNTLGLMGFIEKYKQQKWLDKTNDEKGYFSKTYLPKIFNMAANNPGTHARYKMVS